MLASQELNRVWALDFMRDTLYDGRPFRTLNVIDEGNREALRIECGVPAAGAELTEDTIPAEAGQWLIDASVSFTKGCYVGQENTARMHHRSKVNRRLVVVPTAEETSRTRIAYPELGLAVEHRRVEDLDGAIVPDWLAGTLAA